LLAIVDNVLDGIVTTNEDGVIEAINPAGARIFGCDAASVIGRNISDLMAVRRRGDLLETLVAEAHDHQREFVGRRLDGTTFPMYMAVSIVALGDRWLYTAIIQDLTESKRLEAERMEKERLVLALEKEKEMREMKSRFVSTLSHELRTPLAAILLANAMLHKFGDRASPEERKEYTTTINEEVEHLSQMISDILNLSRTEATGLTYNPEPRSIEMLCLEVLSEVQKATRSRHKITFSGPNKPVEAMVDDKLLRHAISNLLTNAIKYSPKGGEVKLELARKRGQVKISVSDQGIGIPEEDLPRLFEPFTRAGNTERISGTGLGLYIVRQAIELHGGTIAVDSKLGVGTTFTITLPVKAPVEAA
jgi:PAS domain S-box-containing protein